MSKIKPTLKYYNQINTDELVILLQNKKGNTELIYNILYKRCYNFLYNWAIKRFPREYVEDIIQDYIISQFNKAIFSYIPEKKSFLNFILNIYKLHLYGNKNKYKILFYNTQKYSSKQLLNNLNTQPNTFYTNNTFILFPILKEIRQLILSNILNLKDIYMRILFIKLYIFSNLEINELSHITGIPNKTLDKRLYRAIDMLSYKINTDTKLQQLLDNNIIEIFIKNRLLYTDLKEILNRKEIIFINNIILHKEPLINLFKKPRLKNFQIETNRIISKIITETKKQLKNNE